MCQVFNVRVVEPEPSKFERMYGYYLDEILNGEKIQTIFS